MSTTRDWMRVDQSTEAQKPQRRRLAGVLIWLSVVVVATFVALAILQNIG